MSRYEDLCRELRAQPRVWLVTGVAGFIGSALLEQLLELGQSVVGLDNFLTGHQRNLDEVLAGAPAGASQRFRFIEGDMRDAACCREACEGADVVLHQAALGSVPRSLEDPQISHECNVDGFLNMVLAARDAKVGRFVYASSSSVYGDHPGLPKVEERIGRQLSPYAVTKYIDELYAGVTQQAYGIEAIGLRYFNVFGRRQDPNGPYAAVIPRWIEALLRGEPCVIFGDGSNSRDYCYVDNAVQANLLAAAAPKTATDRAYNVGVGGRTTLTELYELIRGGLARRRPELAEKRPTYGDPRLGDVLHSQADISAIVAQLGFEPTHQVQDGLIDTIAWFFGRA